MAEPTTVPLDAGEAPPRRRPGRGRRAVDGFLRRREASVLLVALGLMIYFRAASDVFLTRDNLVNIAQATAPVAIVAAGIVLLLVSGEIDLSVGIVAALAPFLFHFAIDFYGQPVLVGLLVALLIAAAVGLVNGLIVTQLKVPSFVTTLGTFFAVQGILLITSHAYPVAIPQAAQGTFQTWLGAGPWASITWALLLVAIFHVILTRTRWGLHTISVGGNPVGATEAGIRASRIKIGNFMITSTLGGLVGIMEAFRINTIDPNIGGGTTLTFYAISAAVIGGTALAGGSGTIVGAFFGALVLAELQNGFNLIGYSANTIFLILGLAILVSMIANQYLSRLRRAGRT
ncbi:sugar ABC transporter permease [Actinoplanes ianthinogenes]|uniref:Autoinducer 2 import system permease protein LsrD n=1 Tax=Actinoplanes ianthinogenes TaxID=122358 RepID=A0ABN6CPC0_9ACTN|nr:ABC transporter permease [Actinoplanes ianthinogenes]BCJ45992.1 sugar ABC transporter permease [Actinoplanes ianthinogenes]GGR25549.1 sugar ABC transporter permease [Actinoplanes ianthinogenes]